MKTAQKQGRCSPGRGGACEGAVAGAQVTKEEVVLTLQRAERGMTTDVCSWLDRSRSRGAAVRAETGCVMQYNVGAQVTKEEVVQTLRRQSKGFQKTSSQFRGVTRHQKGKFEARCGAPADLFQALLGAKCQSAA